ncbi:probable insulin-like peptide 7 [Zeugodacus cucurbitae]|uniref:Probable insulin-like peptide 7 n=1 Tax=Zeugodacus cucurbitae TaxID=28588 RepID=A0A0A1WF57_ZEUCU|nr:probable insulin-like peptide 7 [Zeugodacus cucurbitae]
MIPTPSILNSSVLLSCLLLCFLQVDSIHTEEGLELLFRERSQSDWENVWHQETHSRCRDKLIRQLYWACEKDIYRLTRRNRKRTDAEAMQKRSKPIARTWLQLDYVNTMLRTRRAGAPSITNECCTKVGCTWEEYAEYCPSNKRRNHY